MSIAAILGNPIQVVMDGLLKKKVEVHEGSDEYYFECKLAPSYGELDAKSFTMMDDELKIMIAGAVKLLEKKKPEERTWDTALAAMMQCTLLELSQSPNELIDRNDYLPKEGKNWFKVKGTPDPAVVEEVKAWVSKLIQDKDVLDSIKMDSVEVLANIVAITGATVGSLEEFVLGKEEFHKKPLVHLGILRFPDLENPFIKIYHLKLFAFAKCSFFLGQNKISNGITGEFHSRIFRPRMAVIKGLSPKVLEIAIVDGNNLFGV